MTQQSRWKQHAATVGFMATVTFAFIAVVSAVHLATAGAVARNETLFMKRAVREAAGLAPQPNAGALEDWYAESVTAEPNASQPVHFRVRDAGTGESTAFVFVRRGAGLWGTITAVVGLTPDCSEVTGVTFVDHNETPGLGARISEDWFKRQFRGKAGRLTTVPEGTGTLSSREFDAITGATITSTAVRDIMNAALAEARRMVGSGPTRSPRGRREESP